MHGNRPKELNIEATISEAEGKITATVSCEEVARLIHAIYGERYQINSNGCEQCRYPNEPSCPWSTRISD